MTGQGDRNFEQIQASRRAVHSIDVHREYRTAQNHRVRGLHKFNTNKTVSNGKVVEAAALHTLIKGQIYMRDVLNHDAYGWIDQVWEEDGSHILHEYLNLVEYRAPEVKQAKLFA